jgi:hypothetical protein
MKFHWFLIALLALTATQASAQQHSSDKQPSVPQIPTIKLAFVGAKESEIGGPGAGSEIQCSPDGEVFFDPWQPSTSQEMGVLAFTKSHDTYDVTKFGLDQISDVHDGHLRDYYATDSLVAMLLFNGTRDDAMSTTKHVITVPSKGEQYEQTVKSGKRGDFIATFDRQGNYKEAVELDIPFKARKIAVFSSGLYLVVGSDTEHKPKFAFVNADGTLQRLLETEKPMHGWEERVAATGVTHGSASPEFLARVPPQLGVSQILSFHDKLLFVWPGLTWIIEISPSGLIRRVPIHVPEGRVIDRFVSSDKMWYASFKEHGADYKTDSQTMVYEINPLDGALIRRFDAAPEYVYAIGCEHDGEFLAMGFREGGYLRLLRGTPQN